MSARTVPVPGFFDRAMADKVWSVQYQQREKDAIAFRKANGITHWSADHDGKRVCLLVIDNQITFCLPPPDGQLYVGGRSGRGAVDDSVRLCEFIYRNVGSITKIVPTLDTHMANQIFHPVFWVDENGNHPDGSLAPFISFDDVQTGKWKVNPAMAAEVAGGNYMWLQAYALHYVKTLKDAGKYQLEIWPYHAMVGSIGYALVPVVEEAMFFHNIVRSSQTDFETKGGKVLTENYSVLQPEVLMRHDGKPVGQKNAKLIGDLLKYDMIIVAGQAKSHCLAWTVENLRTEIKAQDPSLTKKVYIMEDCTSPVVIPGVIDFTDMANAAFDRFAADGMNIVKSTTPIDSWPNSPLR